MTAVTPTDHPKSVRNSCVIKVFGGVFMLSRCFLDCSVGVGVFVTGLSQISSFFYYFSTFYTTCLAKDHWRGFSTRNAHMVHIVNLIRLKWCIHLSKSLYLNYQFLSTTWTRQIIRYRATATLRRPQNKQYSASKCHFFELHSLMMVQYLKRENEPFCYRIPEDKSSRFLRSTSFES